MEDVFQSVGSFLGLRPGRVGCPALSGSNYYYDGRPGLNYLHEVLPVTSRSCRLRSLNAIPCLALAEDSGHEQYSINRIQVLRLRLTQYKFLGVFFLVGWWWHFPSLSEQYL